MIDESFDKTHLQNEPQPWEFRTKPAWQRLIIMVGGVTVNFILGFFIWGLILFVWGEKYLPTENVTYGVYCDSLALSIGMEHGDKIISVDNRPFKRFRDLRREIIFNKGRSIQVQRDGQIVNLPLKTEDVRQLASQNDVFFAIPQHPFVVEEVGKGTPAQAADFQVGDSLIALNNIPISYFMEFREKLIQQPNQTVTITLVRENETLHVPVKLNEKGQIGIIPYGNERFLKHERLKYSLGQAIPGGVRNGINFLKDTVKGFGLMFQKDSGVTAQESLGGFISIAKLFPPNWQWERFWQMTAILSLILAFMNLLPIPLLDGGHVMFLLYEMVTGRQPSDKFMEYAQIVGLVFVFGLLLFANGLDILRLFK